MSYPSPAVWRSHAERARKLAEAYRAEGNLKKAEQREMDAAFYEGRATLEEWRLAEINEHQQEAA